MTDWKKPSFLALAVLFILAVPALRSLSRNGFYTSHDGETHAARVAQYYLAIKDGQFPPRFAGSFYNGLGSPIFVYIYPLPYIFGSLWHFTGFSYADSFKLTMAAAFIFSGVFSYLWFLALFKNVKAAFAGALYYIWVPYRFSLIYVRASVSEILAYAFVPAAFFTITKLFDRGSKIWIPLISFAIAGILLSQSLVAMIVIPVLAVYALILALSRKSWKKLVTCALAFVGGFFISSFVYIPVFLERDFVRLDDVMRKAYANHFVSFKQLIRSPWGYGFDLPGVVNDQMSFQIGLGHLFVITLTILIIVFTVFSLVKSKKFKLLTKEELVLAGFLMLITAASIFLMLDTKLTFEVWQKLKVLEVIDIPWRLNGLIVVSSAFFTALIIKKFNSTLLLIFLTVLVLYANRNHLRINLPRDLNDKYFENYGGSATQYNEFTPRWRQTDSVPDYLDIGQKFEVLEGDVKLAVEKNSSKELRVKAEVVSPTSKIIFYKAFFPGMEVWLNNNLLKEGEMFEISNPINMDVERDKDKSGLPKLILPKGDFDVRIVYKETPIRRAADYISLAFFATAFILFIYYVKKQGR